MSEVTISHKQMLERMNGEVREAMAKEGDTARVREHVRAVKMLCELLLEEESTTPDRQPSATTGSNTGPTAAEIRKMMGGDSPEKNRKKEDPGHEDANGSSIFDF